MDTQLRAADRRRRRKDPVEARAVIERLLPDTNIRAAILIILAESIDQAHRAGPGAWELTLDLDKPVVRLNVGQVYAFSIEREHISVAAAYELLESTVPSLFEEVKRRGVRFKILPNVRFVKFSPEELRERWPHLAPAYRAAVSAAAEGFTRSPFYSAHSPGVVVYLEETLGRAVPQPNYAGPEGDRTATEELVHLVRKRYPGWTGFDDPRFVADERDYKAKAVKKAGESLNRDTLASLLATGSLDEFIRRLDLVGKDNNLLYRGVPMAGDLGILYQEQLDKAGFCRVVFDLLYGEGDAPVRLGRYLGWVTAQGLPNKWTFPTYFLWACWPETEVFVKPSVAQATVKLLGSELDLGTPDAGAYAEFRQLVLELKEALASYGPRDMTDVQSFLFVAAKESETGPVEGAKLDAMEEPIADAAFRDAGFELLAQLKATPTKDFYLGHKGEFAREIEEPFQRLFQDVVSRLPPAITDRMETKRNVFARILKNDYGRGGAWHFYWGALYPIEGRRIEDAQLFLSLHADRLEFGFYVGQYGGEKGELFRVNARRYEPLLAHVLEGYAGPKLDFGEPDGQASGDDRGPLGWRAWLSTLSSQAIGARAMLGRDDVLRTSAPDLAEAIAKAFVGLFPLVYFVGSQDPTAEVRRYLEEEPPEEGKPVQPLYSIEAMAADCTFDEEQLRLWARAIERKGQAVLYGPPGTGKTFVAKALAKHIVGGGDGFTDLVQFHPSYAYEDFIVGIRPKTLPSGDLTYENAKGRFMEFCDSARGRTGKCVLIIDELNRANLSRVFGELMYLLEYRTGEVPLAGGVRFQIPANVRLIGTMNTADRSIALVDHALRRRFAFLRLQPNYNVLARYHERYETAFPVEKLVAVLKALNGAINNSHFEVGISFFLSPRLAEDLEHVWRMEIEPYLEEYFFDQESKVNDYRWDKVRERLGLGG